MRAKLAVKEPGRWGDYVISPEEFEEDLRYLSEEGYTAVTATQLIGFVNGVIDGLLAADAYEDWLEEAREHASELSR